MNRQVYYRAIRSYKNKQKLSKKVIDLVNTIRISMPRIGTRKIFYLLKSQLKAMKVGRDKLFKILKANNLLILPKKKYHITTDSHHRFRKHKNRIKHLEFIKPEQVWVSDITYIGTRENPSYLALVTDAYSKKIMGYDLSNSLNLEGSLRALEMAISNRKYNKKPIIHHSDRGLQYCSNEYQKVLKVNNISPSMTEKYDPYENAIAERVNGILKQVFAIDKYETSLDIKTQLIKNAIEVYNQKRPHLSNSMLTPNQMHKQNKLRRKTYEKTKGSNLKLLPYIY